MVKPTTVRVVLSLALSNNWSIRQIDINNAFLNGDLSEVVYMTQPPGFVQGDSSLVCRLNKALYGLKQAPRAWFQKLQTYLFELGFTSAKFDVSLFTKFSRAETLLVLVYVDDIIITGSSASAINQLVHSLNTRFPLKDLGDLNFFL